MRVFIRYSCSLAHKSNPVKNLFTDCKPRFNGNFDCDEVNNNALCGYDDNDCCVTNICSNCMRDETCTCHTTGEEMCYDKAFPSGKQWYYDHYISKYISIFFAVCQLSFIEDGNCDGINNKVGCDYDGGDCYCNV